MTEWANGMSSSMWAGYSSVGGLTKNPYGDYFPGGSSTGSAAAVAANFTTIAVGTETSASILSPSIQNAIVGIKPKKDEYILESDTDLYYSQQMGIDYSLQKYQLDAILFPSYIGADLSARAGYPSIAVPAGFQANGRAFGITFAGTAFSEATLIRIAYAFEQATKHRRMPNLL